MTRHRNPDSKAVHRPPRIRSTRRSKTTAQGGEPASNVSLQEEVNHLTRELAEVREQQTATSEVLRVISSSLGELEPAFQAMLASAMRICDANCGIFFEYVDGACRALSSLGVPPAFDAYCREKRTWGPHTGLGQIIRTKQPAHILDVREQRAYADQEPNRIAAVEMGGIRTIVVVPLLKDEELIGAFSIFRREVRAFTDKQIDLVTNFARQAVIAIENARLFEETQRKSRQVEEQAAELAEWNRTLETRVAEQVAQLSRMSKLERFLSPKISSLIMAGEADDPLKTRRAEITVVYVDLRGFTAFTETTDPEEVIQVLREYHAELGKAITAHDGTIEHFAGDGAMILFNAPMPMENHELQAIQMTLQVRESVNALAAGWKKRGFDLGFGAGIAGGYATMGTIGFAERLDYSAIGTVCNLASRLCGEASDGQILISPRVFVKVENQVETESVGELTLKGFHRPVTVYKLVRLCKCKPAEILRNGEPRL